MKEDLELRQAFETTQRYERYKLVRTIGLIIIVIGIGRFLLSWILDQTLFHSLNLDIKILVILRWIIQIILLLTLIFILLYSYLSTKKTSINQGGNIVSIMDIRFAFALIILIYLTFFLHIIASVYFEEAIGIFICYFILRNRVKNDLRELLHLGVVLLTISIIEVLGRILLVLAFYGHEVFVPILMVFYVILAVIFVIPYVIFGRRIILGASSILQKPEGII